MKLLAYAIVALLGLLRLAELYLSRKNTRALLARGAVEHGGGHYKFIVALHLAWFAALIVFLPEPLILHGWALALFAVLIVLRLWVMASLGPWFTTRIITIDHEPLVQSGPYRLMRHPNYAIVAGEVAVLPLVFGEWHVALVFSLLNTFMLAWRIRAEDRALAPRRSSGPGVAADTG